MVKEEEEEIMEAGGGSCGYMEYTMLGVGEEDYFLTSPPSYFSYTTSSATTTTTTTPTCSSYLSFYGEEHQDALAFHYATTSPISSKPHNKKGRGGDQRSKHAAAATATKKPRVRKERLGERIVALQQLVSPFGKSDTASVLHEALGYIRFLHEQVKVLSSPYMQRLQTCVPHIPKLVDTAGATVEPRPGDLRSRGLCLVPVSCTEHVAGSSNGADLWSAAAAENKACATAFRINHLYERN